ncbi:CRISPR-associated endonuclease Cas3'' [Trichloromonas sp.]|uniref:CRISPR-associated endonuclease Cas3'' n=1 Tax=Trichloromonas sp. TaxID=3069249 RepID=UPI003D815000
MKKHIAHVAEDGRTHDLEEHLRQTAERAAGFAAAFGADGWARAAGLWHDLGKYSSQFQQYIQAINNPDAHVGKTGGDHSTAGALHALERFGMLGRILTYPIAGHHAGLPDWNEGGTASLAQRLEQKDLLEKVLSQGVPDEILEQTAPTEKAKSGTDISRSLWLRMLFSCLVDADFIDTEAFFEPDKSRERGDYPTLSELCPWFDTFMRRKLVGAADTSINRIRADILNQCLATATQAPGVYSLTVPTGGGKTLSSLAFALHHAVAHGQRRIIYVIPYTSIIEQTANQFRDVWKDVGDVVIEHHSNLDVNDERRDNNRSRLACENWDAPVIVTTTVQFFESLFASRTSRCRKLHNIAGSVVILDEAQLLPPDFLTPILEVLSELRNNYGVTILLCTATQPALGPHKAMDFDFKGLSGVTEIMADPAALFGQLKRTELSILGPLQEPRTWDDISARLQGHDSALCIVSRRDDARILWELMPHGTIHLSALMCGAHRSQKITEIKGRLQAGLSTRVISTQLVEAGVDVDFPVVYRALAGLDSVAQAAGRCNREGLREKGHVYVFTPPSDIPVGHLRQAAEIGRTLLMSHGDTALSPGGFEEFFRRFYWMRGDRLDKERIIDLLKNDLKLQVSFREAARRFKLINEAAQASVIVRYQNDDLISRLEREPPDRQAKRKLQRYVVNLPRRLHGQLLASGAIREVHPDIFVQSHAALYDDMLGFCPDKSIVYDPDDLMC